MQLYSSQPLLHIYIHIALFLSPPGVEIYYTRSPRIHMRNVKHSRPAGGADCVYVCVCYNPGRPWWVVVVVARGRRKKWRNKFNFSLSHLLLRGVISCINCDREGGSRDTYFIPAAGRVPGACKDSVYDRKMGVLCARGRKVCAPAARRRGVGGFWSR